MTFFDDDGDDRIGGGGGGNKGLISCPTNQGEEEEHNRAGTLFHRDLFAQIGRVYRSNNNNTTAAVATASTELSER